MLQNQSPVRRWKQWLVLPALGGLFFIGSHAALAQGGPVPSEAQQKANKDDIHRKVREALRQDSLRTSGKYEPGTTQQVNIMKMDGKPGEAVVTVTRVPIKPPLPPEFSKSGAKVYAYVEQMPALPGGGGQQAIVNALLSKISYPKAAPGEKLPSGMVFANFTVDTDGTVQAAKIVKGLSPTFDDAVLASIKQLPRFEPGKQSGQAVAVSFTVPIKFQEEK